ncbi:uncharacterized protein GGS22DRAFT_154162 [Annulohypoxylon maeteangense]|uniref:uncharacterized protein n=1 Tax=Annulohypoxylon maeteangense TaxID=1927788 RepID=UPI0020074F80|nr:uncharacterized protein GGS22DRAFT_154162 [Annulohypoxylon maeteangense]KAI0887749.1 hypothetical protein GGS22DRAFT_154162 [Annulohypoxylon maeteangense]
MPKFLIPARDSRHRTACFALYRALLKEAPNVPLPDQLREAWGPGNPIKHLIRRAFRRNRADTSPRIVFPALKAGYQMLALLKASSPPTLQWARNLNHESIITFLRSRLRERNLSLEAKALHPPNSRNPPKITSAPKKETVPLLVNVTPEPTPDNPHPTPVYTTPNRPRPLEELGGSGKRHIPRLDMASDIPFLRIKKPQPPVLNRVLTQKIKKRVERYDSLGNYWDEMLPDAELEDAWEKDVGAMLKTHRMTRPNGGGNEIISDTPEIDAIFSDFSSGNTFGNTTKRHAIDYLHNKLNEERLHEIARADAMRKLIEEETALAEQEKVQRIRKKRAMKQESKLARAEGRTDESSSDQWDKLVAASEAAKRLRERESRPAQFLE